MGSSCSSLFEEDDKVIDLGKERRKKMSIIPSREKSKENVGKDKITAVTNAQMLNIKESLNQEVRIRNEEETISFWETKKPQVKTNSEHKIQRSSRIDQTRKKEPPIKPPKDAKGDTKTEPVKQPLEPQAKDPEPEEATAISEAPDQTPEINNDN